MKDIAKTLYTMTEPRKQPTILYYEVTHKHIWIVVPHYYSDDSSETICEICLRPKPSQLRG